MKGKPAQDHYSYAAYAARFGQERGASLGNPEALCCRPAKPVLEIDAAGNVVQEWGGPGPGYTWPVGAEHGIFVDHKDIVWLAAAQPLGREI